MSTTTTGRAFSAPATPSFIVPPKPPRKRLSNLGLSIETPDPAAPSQTVQNGLGIAPPTPSELQPRTFRFLQSASSLQAISSPTVAPEGGMKLPPFGKPSVASRLGKGRPLLGLSHSYETATSSPITVQTLEHVQEENDYELPLSREAKSPAYPEGPVCIYDPHVYLYLEPNDTEAAKFDVVLNVAREVVNPFEAPTEKAADFKTEDPAVQQVSFGSSNIHLLDWGSKSEPQTAVSESSFRSAFETLPEEVVAISSSPESLKAPEYIHIPWDHNTNVVDDLLRLCELIENRVQNGKRVLVHCQCGVSRSASLVVAYGLYKNPQLTVQEAYNAVKDRSRWIGPNMNLIYQLSEFKSKLPRTFTPGSSNWHSSRYIGLGRSNPKATFSGDSNSATPPSSLRIVQTEPTSAPFQKDPEPTPARANSFSPPGSTQVVETSAIGDISPGPSSAPPDMQWTPSEQVPNNNRERKYETTDDLNARSLFPTQTMDIDPPSQMKTSMSAPNIMDFGTTDITLKAEASHNKMNIDFVEQKPVALSQSDTIRTTNAELELTSLSPLKLRDPPIDVSEPTQTSQLGFMDIDSTQPTPSPSPLAKSADIEIAFQRANALPSPATKAVETAIRLPPSFTSDELKRVKIVPDIPPVPPSPILPAGFSSLSARRAKSSLALRQTPLKPLRPQLSLIRLRNPALEDIPPTPSLLSPRAAEFTASPFHRTAAGDLAGSSFLGQGILSPRVEEDPRSPATRGEAPITRSIFDVL
jgi:tyrosine-protein phosphatase